jgi:hypothetical protein
LKAGRSPLMMKVRNSKFIFLLKLDVDWDTPFPARLVTPLTSQTNDKDREEDEEEIHALLEVHVQLSGLWKGLADYINRPPQVVPPTHTSSQTRFKKVRTELSEISRLVFSTKDHVCASDVRMQVRLMFYTTMVLLSRLDGEVRVEAMENAQNLLRLLQGLFGGNTGDKDAAKFQWVFPPVVYTALTVSMYFLDQGDVASVHGSLKVLRALGDVCLFARYYDQLILEIVGGGNVGVESEIGNGLQVEREQEEVSKGDGGV